LEFLKNSSPAQIEERVKEVLEKAKKRGNFILSTSDWWTDDMPYENLEAFSKAGHKYGKY
jgi:uroporphyrinogen-III decarboxylase